MKTRYIKSNVNNPDAIWAIIDDHVWNNVSDNVGKDDKVWDSVWRNVERNVRINVMGNVCNNILINIKSKALGTMKRNIVSKSFTLCKGSFTSKQLSDAYKILLGIESN